MGDKIEAKKIAKKYGLPIIEGSEGGVGSLQKQNQFVKNWISNFNKSCWWRWWKRNEDSQ